MEFTDFPNDGDVVTVAPKMNGQAAVHTFGLSYGITDPLDFFLEVPFQDVQAKLNLVTRLNGKGDPLGRCDPAQEHRGSGQAAALQGRCGGQVQGGVRLWDGARRHSDGVLVELLSKRLAVGALTPRLFLPPEPGSTPTMT